MDDDCLPLAYLDEYFVAFCWFNLFVVGNGVGCLLRSSLLSLRCCSAAVGVVAVVVIVAVASSFVPADAAVVVERANTQKTRTRLVNIPLTSQSQIEVDSVLCAFFVFSAKQITYSSKSLVLVIAVIVISVCYCCCYFHYC